eukprot:TRINITY_DN3977_c0_g1_i1.p1 TRINITY_DN3977_c0_g1~~TRINITY_DN3977_c0_g1_i1.p1  ORF type:complete len:457 (-),score=67.27 TRINITY_DN3977_c0_g1_i1:71-1441(-)
MSDTEVIASPKKKTLRQQRSLSSNNLTCNKIVHKDRGKKKNRKLDRSKGSSVMSEPYAVSGESASGAEENIKTEGYSPRRAKAIRKKKHGSKKKGRLRKKKGASRNITVILRKQKVLKKAIKTFNEHKKPFSGLQVLIDANIIKDDAKDIANFLHEAGPKLSKIKLGELFGENHQKNDRILEAYIQHFDFVLYDFDVALRKLLFSFELPKESGKIDRILKTWSGVYYRQNPGYVPNSRSVYILAFATIMLNTDAHDPNVRVKMNRAQFIENVKFNKGSEDIPIPVLEDLYPRIVDDEIKTEEGATFPTATKKDWMLVRSSARLRLWKKRWVILTETHVIIVKKIGSVKVMMKISLDGLLFAPSRDASSGKEYSYVLEMRHSQAQCLEDDEEVNHTKETNNTEAENRGHKTTIFAAKDKSTLEAWMRALSRALMQFRKSKVHRERRFSVGARFNSVI